MKAAKKARAEKSRKPENSIWKKGTPNYYGGPEVEEKDHEIGAVARHMATNHGFHELILSVSFILLQGGKSQRKALVEAIESAQSATFAHLEAKRKGGAQ